MNGVHHWLGRPVTELNKEELLDVINHLANKVQSVEKDRKRWQNAADAIKYLRGENE